MHFANIQLSGILKNMLKKMKNTVYLIFTFLLFSQITKGQNIIIFNSSKKIEVEQLAFDKKTILVREKLGDQKPVNEIEKTLIQKIILKGGKELNQTEIQNTISTKDEIVAIKILKVSNLEILNYANNYVISIGDPIKLKAPKKFDIFEKDEFVEMLGINVSKESEDKPGFSLIIQKSNGQINNFKFELLSDFEIVSKLTPNQIWEIFLIKSNVYKNLSNRGFQYDIRSTLNDDNNDYLKKLIETDQFVRDDYFEDYLYSISNKIHKGVLMDGRQGNVNFKIIKNPTPNAFCLSNGTIILTSGLISTIESEAELVAILSHEIAHFILDHPILNINMQIDRKKRAEFWATFATIAAGAADVYLGTKNNYHPTGILTYNVAMASAILANEVLVRLGLVYSQTQETEADNISREIVESLGYSNKSLGVALTRIKNNLLITGNYNIFSSDGTHPEINSRIGSTIPPEVIKSFVDKKYLKYSSFINSLNAQIELDAYAHHLNAEYISNRNIENGFGIETDYLVKAKVLRRLNNSDESNQMSVKLLLKAKELNVNPNPLINKELGLTYNRLMNPIEANKSFEAYLLNLKSIEKTQNNSEIYTNEIEWVKQMIFKNKSN
jgi:Zn-dependent protease with chaperone function